MLRIAVLAALSAASLAAHAVDPGEWEITVQAVMTGSQKPAVATKKQCFTDADSRDPSRVLGQGGTCKFSNKNESAGAMSFDVDCTGLMPMQGKGSVVYTGQLVEGSLDLHATADSNFKMQTIMKGRRLGPC
jgi:hypothetical protein